LMGQRKASSRVEHPGFRHADFILVRQLVGRTTWRHPWSTQELRKAGSPLGASWSKSKKRPAQYSGRQTDVSADQLWLSGVLKAEHHRQKAASWR